MSIVFTRKTFLNHSMLPRNCDYESHRGLIIGIILVLPHEMYQYTLGTF